MRKDAKSARRTRCEYSKCNKDPFLKNLAYYYKGMYFCCKNHRIKHFKESAKKNDTQDRKSVV